MSQMRVCIIGHFAYGQIALNGQTVKTHNLYGGFKKYTSADVTCIDTYGWEKKPIALYKNIVNGFKNCDHIIMLPAQNGVRIFAPLLVRLNKKYCKKIYYDVIGGWLPKLLQSKPKLKKTVGAFTGIWVETLSMKRSLCDMGIDNVTVVPNFKELAPLGEDKLETDFCEPFKLCTFSRVSRVKGIEDAVNAVIEANSIFKKTVYTLDIYGQIDSSQKEWFEKLEKTFPDYIRYCGCVASNESVGALKKYFALLFPTYYEGEGFAGTLIDAYAAGVPVIASDWKFNSEFVNKNTGILFPPHNVKRLAEILNEIRNDPKTILDKRKKCLSEAQKYTSENVMKDIVLYLSSSEPNL